MRPTDRQQPAARSRSGHPWPGWARRAGARAGLLLVLSALALLGASGGLAARPAPPVLAGAVIPLPGALPVPVPPLPFAGNPDPNACGIPTAWGDGAPAWITGYYRGRLVEPVVYLYDSHVRKAVVGRIPSGGRVRIVLSQTNPVLNFYLVRSLDLTPMQEGWVPAPFVSLQAPRP